MTLQVNQHVKRHLLVKFVFTFKAMTFILFFHILFYLPLEIIDLVANNTTD